MQDSFKNYDQIIEEFRPVFGNTYHIKAAVQIKKVKEMEKALKRYQRKDMIKKKTDEINFIKNNVIFNIHRGNEEYNKSNVKSK